MMPPESVNGFEAGSDDFHHFMLTTANKLGQRCADAALFIRSDQIEYSWELTDPILKAWDTADAPPLAVYDPGTWGPKEADDFMQRDGRLWLMGCGDRSREQGAVSPIVETQPA